MRTWLLILLATAGLALPSRAADWPADEAANPAWTLEAVSEDAGGVELEFRLRRLDWSDGAGGPRLALSGAGQGAPGQPDLPLLSRLLAVPARAGLGLEILDAETAVRAGAPPAPVEADLSENPDAPAPSATVADEAIYGSDGAWPERPARLETPAVWRGQRVVPLVIQPVSWDPGAGVYRATTRLRLRLSFAGSDFRNLARADRAPSPVARAALAGALLNGDRLAAAAERVPGDGTLGRYLVLSPDAALGALQPWVDWRRQQGWIVTVVPLSEFGVSPDFAALRVRVQAEYDGPGLDYLLLVGDIDRYPSGTESQFNLPAGFIAGGTYAEPEWGGACGSPYCIVSDHLYSLLEGDDVFADILVGRLSVDNLNQAHTQVTKLVSYEKEPFLGQGDEWFGRGLVIYDVAMGLSRRETKLAVRDMLLEHAGFSQVDTIRNHAFNNQVNPLIVKQRVEAGVSLVNYRGYGYRHQWYGPLFGVTEALALTNVGRWPLVTSIVCGGGDFASRDDDPCFGEAWMRSGSPTEPAGAIGFIAPSEEDTHVKWNNAIDLGIYQGLVFEDLRRLGDLMDRGKTELWNVFPNDRNWGVPGQNVPFYFHCYNLLGDPGLELRAAAPKAVVAELPQTLPVGPLALELWLQDEDGAPLAGATVCLLRQEGDGRALGVADAGGRVLLESDGLEAGDWTLTVHGRDLIPLQGTVVVEDEASRLRLLSLAVDGGDGDGFLSPGELAELRPEWAEIGLQGFAEARTLGVESDDPRVGASTATLPVPATEPGDTLRFESGLAVSLSPWLAHGDEPAVWWTLDGERIARTRVPFAAFGCDWLETQTLDGALEPGSTATLRLRVSGAGQLDGADLVAELHSLLGEVAVTQPQGAGFDLAAGEEAWVGDFEVEAAASLLPGTQAGALLLVRGAGDDPATVAPRAVVPLTLAIGEAQPGDPFGPDAGGYVCFHSEDVGWEQAPAHDWQSIVGAGEPLGLVDTLDDPFEDSLDGRSEVVELPFEFAFYGVSYDRLTVCTNGWAAFGDQRDHWTAINTPIPAAQGPPAMVAVYWTDLIDSDQWGAPYGDVYVWHDVEAGRFVVEWNHFRPEGLASYLDAQLVLLDPEIWPTATGDGSLLMVYGDTPTSAGENGFTAGIENADETFGLQLAFNGQTAGGQPVEEGVTLLFTPAEPLTAVGDAAAEPRWFGLGEAAPNPFNPSTRVPWRLDRASRLEWSLTNLLGQRVRSGVLDRAQGAGWIAVDGASLGSGLYLLDASAESGGETVLQRRKLLLVK